MSDTDLDKERVYVVYRELFKDTLAKLRKGSKFRNVVEKHKDHVHLTDSMDTEKTCRILRALLIAYLFESKSVAEAIFPTLFSTGEFGTEGQEEGVEGEHRQGDGENADASFSSDALLSSPPLPDSAIPFRLQHRILCQTQRLLEECCYDFAERWLPSMLEANGWDAPEAVELTACKMLN
ncbi:uncharacterized protein PAC_18282 [Phialocephala subalpina]|uniref:Uncharacterized protein n=1 Tax=Phialocephala subalpina TaxID=576137 RepID=A0A1L7XTL9_9HELO|nr:uncharacterized protein PAC_18282 [Phialocephala subalpina]